jgi:hypothetical protein
MYLSNFWFMEFNFWKSFSMNSCVLKGFCISWMLEWFPTIWFELDFLMRINENSNDVIGN